MSLPPVPPPIEHLTNRPFTFYPAILNIEHNEWLFRRVTWSEIMVVNSRTGLEIWIPRRFLGEISRIEDPVVIVGLVKELEYKAGSVWPHQRSVIEMPVAVGQGFRSSPPPSAPAPVVGIRLESQTDSRASRLVITALVLGVFICGLAVTFFRQGPFRPRTVYNNADQSYLDLKKQDDYYALIRKLGPPADDRWRSETGELQYRALWYPQRAYIVILMGTDRESARYIGTLDRNWNPIHGIEFPGGGNTLSMLRNLPKF